MKMARSLDRPLRYFLAKRQEGPVLIVAARIDAIYQLAEERRGSKRSSTPAIRGWFPLITWSNFNSSVALIPTRSTPGSSLLPWAC